MPTDDINAYLAQANSAAAASNPEAPGTELGKEQILSALLALGEDEVLAIFREYINRTGGETAPAPRIPTPAPQAGPTAADMMSRNLTIR